MNDSSQIPVFILAGGFGTRLSEETETKPKPMVEIGGYPILWHIMKHYNGYGHNEFFIALGYKGEIIKRYFLDYYNLSNNVTIDMANGKVESHAGKRENWKIHLIDTGLNTNTGGRLKRFLPWIKDKPFMLTYGDGVSNVDLKKLMKFHRSHGLICTVTAVRPPSRFGGLIFNDHLVAEFTEKPQIGEGWINGGFMIFEPKVFEYIQGDETNLESDVLETLAAEGQLTAYRHEEFWQCMDTLRDKRLLERFWKEERAPWKTWV